MAARFQFSVRLMLAAMAAIAAALAAVCAEPSFQSAFAINGLTVALGTVAIVAMNRTLGTMRTFWAGTVVMLGSALLMCAMSSWTIFMYVAGGHHHAPQGENRFLWLFWCIAPVNGLLAVIVDWLFARRPFRFWIHLMLPVAAAVAAAVAASRDKPSLPSAFAIIGLTVVFATAAVVAVIQTRGRVRTFWVGTGVMLSAALATAAVSTWMMLAPISGGYSPQGSGECRFLWIFWCAAPINGIFAVIVHWLFSPSG